jgi:multisubunit Na+/H+ antiporter MnhE subunit
MENEIIKKTITTYGVLFGVILSLFVVYVCNRIEIISARWTTLLTFQLLIVFIY